ncbi:hypothetical protein F2P81_000182 [Scophthalmus maximus]|uniref:Uncharacterized protein n=1 Tax=Scophthalmus maximus TaxID=52904 RepID=A0A6A4TNX9_SCOMX|nr:hypothetical protein F2P81_000182 [Scophthalmus maximus]
MLASLTSATSRFPSSSQALVAIRAHSWEQQERNKKRSRGLSSWQRLSGSGRRQVACDEKFSAESDSGDEEEEEEEEEELGSRMKSEGKGCDERAGKGRRTERK